MGGASNMTDEYIRKADAVDELRFEPIFSDTWNVLREARDRIKAIKPADVTPVVFCKDCIHNNDCDIQYSAQAGENFFCGFGETEKDVREDVYE